MDAIDEVLTINRLPQDFKELQQFKEATMFKSSQRNKKIFHLKNTGQTCEVCKRE